MKCLIQGYVPAIEWYSDVQKNGVLIAQRNEFQYEVERLRTKTPSLCPSVCACDQEIVFYNCSCSSSQQSNENGYAQVAAGRAHFLAVDRAGELLAWGDNRCGQLGLEIAPSHHIIDKNGSNVSADTGDVDGKTGDVAVVHYWVEQPQPVSVPNGHDTCVVVDVACGAQHSLCVLSNGTVYAAGSNEFGQCGWEQPERKGSASFQPIRLPPVDNLHILRPIKVAAGWFHSLVVCEMTKIGDVRQQVVRTVTLGFGCSNYGQLAVVQTVVAPARPVPGFSSIEGLRVVDIDAGAFHSAFVSDNGELFQCGWLAGKTSRGRRVLVSEPRLAGHLAAFRVTKVHCGDDHTVVETQQGVVFGNGAAQQHQLDRVRLPGRRRSAPSRIHTDGDESEDCSIEDNWVILYDSVNESSRQRLIAVSALSQATAFFFLGE